MAAPSAPPIETTQADRAFLMRLGLFYIALSLAMLFALDRFWSNNWDVEIITQATRSLWDGGSPFDLYEKSRATWPWPFPYPPHSALILVPFIALADLITGGPVQAAPQLIAIRIPPLLADIGIAWLLHRILREATGELWIARLGAAVWLFNPVLFYHTTVQAHQESTWLLPALAALAWVQAHRLERPLWPSLLLVVAISLKQSAVLYAAPFLLYLLWHRRWGAIAGFAGLFVLLFGGISLPWHLYSGDFAFLVFEAVQEMPVQVQSWQVWVLALPQFRVDQTSSTFPTVRHASLLVMAAAAGLGGWALWRQRSWYAIGLLGTLAFFLFSQKVMGYHYPMLLPWLLAFGLRARRFALVSAGMLWTAWVVVSPYFAPWADAAHLPLYATLGTLNSLFFGWLLWQALVGPEDGRAVGRSGEVAQATRLARWSVMLALAFVLTTLAQPVARAIVGEMAAAPPTMRLSALLGLLSLLFGASLLLFAPVATWAERALGLPLAAQRSARPHVRYAAAALLFVPLFFTWFTMTTEVTAVIERGIFEAWNLL